ncbi:MAG: excinuclease ABC subunit UvrA, partial [Planctomycetia bacterium]|nr:excinuclease ABC subunit UvrA [Planctomycetia bacterium]
GDETVIFCYNNNGQWHDLLYSTRYACPQCELGYEEIEPRSFSFNSPYGACEACDGLGSRVEFDPDLVFPNRELSLSAGAVSPWKGLSERAWKKIEAQLAPFLRVHKLTLDTPLAQWKPAVWEQFLRGTPSAKNGSEKKRFPGVVTMLEREYATTLKPGRQQRLAGYRGEVICPECNGARLNPQARNVRLGGLAIHELTALAASRARAFCAELTFDASEQPIAEPLMREINNRLEFLSRVGVDYLSLNRSADSLSGGELQRVRLATGIGSGLVGVCYVLDEPSIGLHPRDNGQLIRALCELRDQGNSVLVVEHDEAMMRASDHLIDMGPGAGLHGGRIVVAGQPATVQGDPLSLTGRYLSGELSIPLPRERRRAAKTRSLVLSGVTTNNLRDVEVTFPLGTLTCVTGVSGSGKSSLINETLGRALARRLTGMGSKPGPHHSLRGASQLDKLVEIDQSPIGRTPRSNPATYTGVFDEIRKVFAGTREARQRGFGPGRFSFNVKRGRCEVCQGQGQQRIDMNFLPDLYVTCPECGGKRFNRQTLEVPYKGLSIAEVLDLRIDDALTFFENFPVIARLLSSLTEVGMGYVTLGQSSITLSGGEAQRIKLATELARVETGNTLYILDEPTTGLHFDDVRKLLEVLQRLVDRGNTVLVIEHNLDVIKSADWLIDLGPEGGEAGGQVIAVGTPEEVAECAESHTGRFLRPLLSE